jgi:hypothetical protein
MKGKTMEQDARLLFTQDGYNFWRCGYSGLWNVTKECDNKAPNCAYRLEYIAKIKNVRV